MGRAWDAMVPGPEIWREVLRCLKPGAFLLAFGGTRTFHRLTCAIEDAGFEIRDSILVPWIYGQGFPKSLNISAAIDKAAGVDREILSERPNRASFDEGGEGGGGFQRGTIRATAPATDDARTWEGYGTALKPAWEPCIVAMKPLDGTFAANALKHGVAGINVDGCRIEPTEGDECRETPPVHRATPKTSVTYAAFKGEVAGKEVALAVHPLGRWPANVILGEEAAELLDASAAEECPSRFFYTSKVRPEERNLGGIDCRHPTLKPLDLCEYLARLILPPKRPDAPRRLLVPFAGAGSEMIGALEAGWEDVTGIELEEQSAEWARARIAAALSLNPAERNGKRNEAGEVLQPGLFD